MSDYITGKLITVGNYTEEEQVDRDNPLARAVVVMPREALKAVRSLPMYEDVVVINAEEWEQLQRENAALQEELNAQAVCNGKGSEREAKLASDNIVMRNEIAWLKSQTMWVCACGGTDCKGQRENLRLRSIMSRIGHYVDHSPDLSQATRLELIGEAVDEVFGKEEQS